MSKRRSLAERAEHGGRSKALYEGTHPETRPTNRGGAGRAKVACGQVGHDTAPAERYTADAAAATGQSERTLRRDAARAAAIPQIAETVGTSLDKGAELDVLARLPADVQAALITLAKAGETVSARSLVARRQEAARAALLTAAIVQAVNLKYLPDFRGRCTFVGLLLH